MGADLGKARARAWKTRRKKYGPHGHNGVYRSAPGELWHGRYRKCVQFLCRLYSEGTLSEGQVAKVTGLDRVTVRKIADALPNGVRERGNP